MFYIYIIKSESSGKYYVGHTDDPERRLGEHNNTENNTYTSKYRPWILMSVFPVSEKRSDAILIEKNIKKRKSRRLLENLISEKSGSNYVKHFFKKVLLKRKV